MKIHKRFRDESLRLENWDYSWNGSYFITQSSLKKRRVFGRIVKGQQQLSEIGLIAQHYWHEIPKHFSFVTLGEFIVMPDHIHGVININKSGKDRTVNGKPGFIKPGLGGPPEIDFEKHSEPNINRDADIEIENHPERDINSNADIEIENDREPNINRDIDASIVGSRHCLDPAMMAPTHEFDTEIEKMPAPPHGFDIEIDGILSQSSNRIRNPGKNTLSSIIGSYKSIVTKNARMIAPDFRWQARFWDRLIQDEDHYRNIETYIIKNPRNWKY